MSIRDFCLSNSDWNCQPDLVIKNQIVLTRARVLAMVYAVADLHHIIYQNYITVITTVTAIKQP